MIRNISFENKWEVFRIGHYMYLNIRNMPITILGSFPESRAILLTNENKKYTLKKSLNINLWCIVHECKRSQLAARPIISKQYNLKS